MIDRKTGRAIDLDSHIKQSMADILFTPIGSRVKRRPYGSMLPDLIDHPGNQANMLRLQAATYMALLRWEPRVALTSVAIVPAMDGSAEIEINGTRRTGPRVGQPINISVPLQ